MTFRAKISGSKLPVRIIIALAWLLVCSCRPTVAADAQVPETGDLTLKDYLWADQIILPVENREKKWDFADGGFGNFTEFGADAKDLKVENRVLRFEMGAQKVLLGWGNYGGKQPFQDRVSLWPIMTEIYLRVRQSQPEKTTWEMHLWHDGVRGAELAKAELKDTEWKELKLRIHPRVHPTPDGFDLSIESKPGNVIELSQVRAVGPNFEGYVRKEFIVPQGKVWRAIAHVGNPCQLFVNGKQVPRESGVLRIPPPWGIYWHASPVDLAPYLRPGRNCIGLYAQRIDYHPYIYFQAQVVMDSGEVLRWQSDKTWRRSSEPAAGWSEPGFDDAAWQEAKTKAPFFYYMGGAMAGYDGRLVMENPQGDKLFYSHSKPVVLRVLVPQGLAAKNPYLRWVLKRVEAEGSREVAHGDVAEFQRRPPSLTYDVELGQLARGLYTIQLSLRSNGELIESRPREPLMVIGKIPMKEVEGKSYEEGMRLTLEDTIDFTDPKDPHPSVEAKPAPKWGNPAQAVVQPRIIRKGKMVYRETGPHRGAMFSYRFQFKHPGSFYMMVVEYPNDDERWNAVSVSTSIPGTWSNSQTGASVYTGDKFPVTDEMRELRWLHVADQGPHTIDVVSHKNGLRAAARRIRIYRVEELPALKVAAPEGKEQRFFGIHTERTYYGSGISKSFGVQDPAKDGIIKPKPGEPKPDPAKSQPMEGFLEKLAQWQRCSENYAQYLRFAGQNLHVMGVFQYNEQNTAYASPYRIPTARLPACLEEVLLRVLEQNGISVYAGVEYTRHLAHTLDVRFQANDTQVAQGADTIWPVSKEGNQAYGYRFGSANFLYPEVEKAAMDIVDDMVEMFADHPNFKGIHILMYPGGIFNPCYHPSQREVHNPLEYSYDDVTIARFEKDTKIRVPVDPKDPQRFQKRHLFLASKTIKPKWVAWRCQQVRKFLIGIRDRLQRQRRDFNCMAMLYMDIHHIKAWRLSGRPYLDYVREFGYDPTIYRKDDGLYFGRWMFEPMHYKPVLTQDKTWVTAWEHHVGAEPIAAYDRERNRGVFIMHQWDELVYQSPGSKELTLVPGSDWLLTANRGRFLAQATADNCREPFTQALIGADPDTVIFGYTDVNILVGHEQEQREFGRVLRSLPAEKFSPALGTGFETNFAIRDLRKGNAYWFYVANPGYWPIRGTVTVRGATAIFDAPTNKRVTTRREGDQLVLPLDLKSYGVAAFRVDSRKAKVIAWKNEAVAPELLTHLSEIVKEGERLIGVKEAMAVLTPEEQKFMREAVAKVKADLAAGDYASAWSMVTDWRFWLLVKEQMVLGEQFGATIAGPKPKLHKPEDLPSAEVVWARSAPRINGRLDDPVWQQAPRVGGLFNRDKGLDIVETVIRAAYDKQNLYLGIECADRDPESLRKEATEEREVFGDDAVAIFLQPQPEVSVYYQLAVNVAGLKFDQRVMGGDRDYDFAPPWQAATATGERQWTLEVALPFLSLGADAPSPGDQWRANFGRRFRGGLVPMSSWSWVRHDWHETDRFGYLKFLGSK